MKDNKAADNFQSFSSIAMPSNRGPIIYAQRAISTIIITILSAQIVAGFVGTNCWGWPILSYPMYSASHAEGDRLVYNVSVSAILVDNSSIKITPAESMKDDSVFFTDIVLPSLRHFPDELTPIIEEYCRIYDRKLIALSIMDSGVAISRSGPVYGLAPREIGRVDVHCK